MAWDTKKTNNLETSNVVFKKLKEAKENRGMKILSFGDFSTGKTHFGLTSPGPIFIIDTENGATPLAEKFPDANVLNISSMNFNSDEEEMPEVENYIKLNEVIDYLVELPDEEVGTIIIDSLTDVWAWCQAYAKIKKFKLSLDDRLKQQFDWGIINAMYSRIIMKLINKNCNVIFTARASEVYAGAGQPTGQYQAACQKKTPYFVDIVLQHSYKFVGGKFVFTAKITKFREDGTLLGKQLDEPTFDKLLELVKNGK